MIRKVNHLDILKTVQYFINATDSQLQSILPIADILTLDARSMIYQTSQPADYFYAILRGQVELAIMIQSENLERRFVSLKEGDSFGIGEIFFDEYYLNAYTQTPCDLLRIHKKDFFEKVITIPSINQAILLDFAYMTKINTLKANWYGARERIVLYLSGLIEPYPFSNNITLESEITNTSIAASLDLSREYVSRIMKSLTESGVIAKKKNKIIVNRAKLKNELPDKDLSGKIKF